VDDLGIAALRHRLELLPRLAIGAVECDHRLGDTRCRRRELAQILLAEVSSAEQRICQYLAEAAHETRLVIGREALEVDAEILRELQQQAHRHRSLIVLDEVEIARGDRELLRHLRLRQARVPSQAPHLVPEHQFRWHFRRPRIGSRICEIMSSLPFFHKTSIY